MRHLPDLERVRYWQGQLLASSDLRTQLAVAAALRRLHNRAVHDAYGVALGFEVQDVQDGFVAVSCGLAYDCSGRELYVPTSRNVAVPTTIAAPQLLMIAYDATADGAVYAWEADRSPRSVDGVAIARLVPDGAGPSIDRTFRPVLARALARPRIANGETVAGNTTWDVWHEGGLDVGVMTTVDTSASGFTTTPNYFAEAASDIPPDPAQPNDPDDYFTWLTSISDGQPDRFTLRLFTHRIARERFAVLDPYSRAAKTPPVGSTVSLASAGTFVKHDVVSRVLPIVADASVVQDLKGSTATIAPPLDAFAGTKTVAFGHPPRLASVTKPPAAASGCEVTVDEPDKFSAGNVVAKLGDTFANARPTTVASIDDAGALELANPIAGLTADDILGVAQTASLVTDATDTTVTVQNPALFLENDIVVCVDQPVEDFTAARITGVSGAANDVLTLDPPVKGLLHRHIAPVRRAGIVQTVNTEMNEVKVQVSSTKGFRKGDLVAKILPGGISTEPVRVESVQSSSRTITLAHAIPGLSFGDQLGAANFPVRATVLNVAEPMTVTVADASAFRVGRFVARLDDQHVPTGFASVLTVASATSFVLDRGIDVLQAGDILALCALPVTVRVDGIDATGLNVEVTPPDAIAAGDVVAALPDRQGTSIVVAARGASVQLDKAIQGLAANDTLSVVTMEGPVDITAGSTSAKVTLETGHRVRVGDILGAIVAWREPAARRSLAEIIDVTGNDLTLSSQLDGLMGNDAVGLADLVVADNALLQLRVEQLPDATPGDQVLAVVTDRMAGMTESVFGSVEAIVSADRRVFVLIESGPATLRVRPRDFAASILFVRGSPLTLVQDRQLYVRWLACETHDPLPRPCTEVESPGPCDDTPPAECRCGATIPS